MISIVPYPQAHGIDQYLEKYYSTILQLGTRDIHRKRNKMNTNTCCAIAMATVLLCYEKQTTSTDTRYILKTLAAHNIFQYFFPFSPNHILIKCSLYRGKHLQVPFQFIFLFVFVDLNSVMNMTLLKKSVKQFLIRRLIDQPSESYVVQACHHQEILLMIKFAFLMRRSSIFLKAQVCTYTNIKRKVLKK